MNEQPMVSLADLDDVTWCCPCGARFVTCGGSRAFSAWVEEHRGHTDGTLLEKTTPRGAVVWTTPPEPTRGPLPVFTS